MGKTQENSNFFDALGTSNLLKNCTGTLTSVSEGETVTIEVSGYKAVKLNNLIRAVPERKLNRQNRSSILRSELFPSVVSLGVADYLATEQKSTENNPGPSCCNVM